MDNKENLTFLGFDFGLKHIGVAVGQNVTCTATPLPIINFDGDYLQKIIKLINEWHPKAIIVGIPNMDKSRPITKAAHNFANEISKTGIPVYEIDERLTTKIAREEVYQRGGYKALQKEAIDSIAAQLILESWLHEN